MSPLISPAGLKALMASGQTLLMLDTRFSLADAQAGQRAFEAGHIPGATYAHLNTDLSAPLTGHNGRHPLPSPAAFQQTLQRWGLMPETRVVVYDDQGGMFAARAWWMLHAAGHGTVQVLDGGWSAWQASTEVAAALDEVDTPLGLAPATHQGLRVDEVLAQLESSGHQQLLDARAPDRFRGENETLDPVGGHIPGALNRFFQLNLGPDGRFKPAPQLRDEFLALLGGIDPRTVVHQCGSGVTACHNLLAMEVAGLAGSRLYPGSWSEWCADASRPLATG